MKRAEPYWPLILALALLKFLLPILLQDPVYELQRDELLYYEQGQHPALGYLENPPLIAWLGTVSSWFGGSMAWIKLWPCLFGAATLVITCMITAELGGKLFAQFIAGLSLVTGAYMRIHFLFQPNILDIFFWTLAVYFIIRWIHDNHPAFLFGFTFSLSLGWWGKYSIVFMGAALCLALLLSRHRKIFTEKKFWIAAAFALLLIVPNLLWQYRHNWPLLHHMKELRETQLRYLNPADFLMEQFLMLFPVLLLWTGGLIWLFKKPSWRFIAVAYIFVLALLLWGSGKSYYALGAYPMLLAAGGTAWEHWLSRGVWKRYVLTGLILVFTLLFVPILLPVWKPEKLASFYRRSGIAKTGVLKWEDGKDHSLPQDFADMLGWKELAEKTEKFFRALPDSVKENTIIFGRHYGHAGSLKFYSLNLDMTGKVISDNGSFILWVPGDLTMRHLLFIGRRMPDKDDEVFQHFGKASVIDSVGNPYSRQYGDKLIFFENIDSSGLRMAIDGLKEMKRRFNR